MKIAARWIDPEGPTGAPGLLPGGEGERILEELGDRDAVQGGAGDVTEGERGLIARLRPYWQEIESQHGGAFEPAEWIGLRVPVHVTESGRKPKRTVLRSLVVRKCDVQRGGRLRLLVELRRGGRFRSGHPHHRNTTHYIRGVRSRSVIGGKGREWARTRSRLSLAKTRSEGSSTDATQAF